jgi:hypothetical protein
MSVVDITLQQNDARLVFLAVAYHLGRPGSELDPLTKQPVEHGLAEVAAGLQPQLSAESAALSLRQDQARRLLSGMLGTISELKAYPMLGLRAGPDGRRSTVPGFDRSLTHLFPEVEEDSQVALDIAENMLMLRRRLDDEFADLLAEPAEAPAAPPKPARKWWPFGRKA